jgi:hypothetical protein
MNTQFRKNLIVVDNFYANPDAVRNFALNTEYEELGGKNWPGRDSLYEHGKDELTSMCSQIVG